MKLSADQLKRFNEQGFVVLPHFFAEGEVAAMRAELDRFKREGLLRDVATEGDGTTHSNTVQNLQSCPIAPKSEFYRAVPFCPKVVAVVRQLIGDPVQHHLDQLFLKPGRQGMGTNWHQDNAYFGLTDPTRDVGVWVALSNVPPTIACPANITTNNATNQCSPSVSFNATASGTPTPTVVCNPSSGSTFSTGTTVNCTASNAAGTDACSFDVTANDTYPRDPEAATKDKGCGGKGPQGALLTDVVEK
jgi:hypothetical protein